MARRDHLSRLLCLPLVFFSALPAAAVAQVAVPEAPPKNARTLDFHDSHYGVRFSVPLGWTVNRKDGEVSTFHLDARTASPQTQMRGVVAIEFNPYPYSTFSGARFYYSVERHSTDAECAAQATGPVVSREIRDPKELGESRELREIPEFGPSRELRESQDLGTLQELREPKDTQDIDGMNFVHGHDEHGQICVEARDEVYTAYRKGSCYRFDLAMNTFCSVSSGAQDLTETQVRQIDQRMTDILSTVKLDWSKSGPHPVPVPSIPPPEAPLPKGRAPLPAIRTGGQ